MKKFLKNIAGVIVVSGIAFFLCGIYAGNWEILHWQLVVKGVFIGITALITYANLLSGNGMD